VVDGRRDVPFFTYPSEPARPAAQAAVQDYAAPDSDEPATSLAPIGKQTGTLLAALGAVFHRISTSGLITSSARILIWI
jgi:hypothetical protein